MTESFGRTLIEMVKSPHNWYGPENFESSKIPQEIFKQMLDDPYHLMRINGESGESFLGGYVLGFALREKLGLVKLLREVPKTYQYVDPLRFAQDMEVPLDYLPEVIGFIKKDKRHLVEKVQISEHVAYRIHVGALAYLQLPVVKDLEIGDLSLRDLIKKYRLGGDDKYKDEFLKRTDVLVSTIVFSNFAGAIAQCNDPETIVNAGKKGAEKGFSMFDLEQEVKAETYLPFKINGAVMDELRALDSVPRNIRSTVKKIKPLIKESRKNNEILTVEQLMELTGKTKETVEEALKLVVSNKNDKTVSLDKIKDNTDSYKEMSFIEDIPDQTSSGRDPARKMEVEDTLSFLLGFLDPRSQEMVVRYHIGGEPMKSIGESLGLSESRVSQSLDKIMPRLQELASRMDER